MRACKANAAGSAGRRASSARQVLAVSLALIMALGTALPVFCEDIYRWRDDDGILHFSDTPPAAADTRLLPSASPTPATSPDYAPPASDRIEGGHSGVFWKIENDLSPPSFLLGTIHSSDPSVMQTLDVVDEALQETHTFVMEMELTSDTFFTIGGAMMLPGDFDLADLLGPTDYRRLVAAMATQPFPEAIMRKMKPWVLMAILSQPKNSGGDFMDLHLYRQALEAGKQVFGLETAEEQLAVFDGLTIEDQVALLRSTLNQLDTFEEMIKKLVDVYLSGDLDAIATLARTTMERNGTDIERRFLRRLNDDRNDRMVRRMIPRIEQGGAFIAVGALHLAGPSGIIRQLSDRGYRLTPMDGR